jgi:DNA-binding NarL/FixJ family response regulator
MFEIRKIGIVDDQALVRKGLSMLVNIFPNHQVIFEAAHGIELQERLANGLKPDLILLDIAMPMMDGYETAKWLTTYHPEIRILALSTMDSEFAIIKMIKNGAKGYVLKDAEPTELVQAIDSMMGKGYFYNDSVTLKVMQNIHHLMDADNLLSVFAHITDRELQFIKQACSEKSYREIAHEMCVSERTVEGYRDAVCKKLNLNTRVGLALFAVKHNLVSI